MKQTRQDEALNTRRGELFADGEVLSRILFERDQRSFPEIISAWVRHENCDGQEFLDKTGLAVVLSKEDFKDIELGNKIPSEQLARVMALHLPGGILRPQQNTATLLELYRFQNRALFWRTRRENEDKPIADINESAFIDFSVSVLQKFQPNPVIVPKSPTIHKLPAGLGMRENILGYLIANGKERGITKSEEEIEALLAAQYSDSPTHTLHGLQALLIPSDFTYSEEELRTYLSAISSSKSVDFISQMALRFLRQSRGMSQKQFADKLGYSSWTIGKWEIGEFPIFNQCLGTCAQVLDLSNEEAKKFISLIRPDIISNVGMGWLEEKINLKDWESINEPALDPQWLEKQPLNIQPGMLLGAYRRRSGLAQMDLGKILGMRDTTISNWESRKSPIPPNLLGTIAQSLSLSDKEAEHFILLISPEIIEKVDIKWLRTMTTSHHWDYINFPALSPLWLSKQPPQKQAGLLLRAYISYAGLTMQEFATQLKSKKQQVYYWTVGGGSIPSSKIEPIVTLLKLNQQEEIYLTDLIRLSETKEETN